ncbi:MAG: hypothetical protein KAQ85_07720, partial [Thermodesulfovibrionia bacterium]|nr:hypothetical protein [Thermodesulfovibrionia bacterium]
EGIDVGYLVGHPTGIKPIVHTTTVLADKSQYRQDGGKRLYILLTDELANKATKAAEEEIILEQSANGNQVIRINIKDHSPAEIAKIYYEMMGFVEWYGNFTIAEILSNLKDYSGIVEHMCDKLGVNENDIVNIDFTDPERASEIMAVLYSNGKLPDAFQNKEKFWQALRQVVLNLNLWFQPGVEWGKTATEKIAKNLYVENPKTDFRTIINNVKLEELQAAKAEGELLTEAERKKVELKVPLRNEGLRQQFYKKQKDELNVNEGAFIVGGKSHQTVAGKYQTVDINTENMPGISIATEGNTIGDVLDQIRLITELRQQQKQLTDTVDAKGNYQLEQRRRSHDALEVKIAEETTRLEEIAVKVTCNEKTAQQLAKAAYEAHHRGQSFNISLYAGRQRLEELGQFVNTLDLFDIFQHATDDQHTDRDGTIAGMKTAFQVIAHVREDHGERVEVDGMVASYWDGLSDQDILYAYHQAYMNVYNEREIDYIDLRLAGSHYLAVAKMYVLFSQAKQIY